MSTNKPKYKIDYPRLYKARASRFEVKDFSRPVIIPSVMIGPEKLVFGPLQYIHTALLRTNCGSALLRNLAIEALQSFSDAQRV
jgi:hypothetical protein